MSYCIAIVEETRVVNTPGGEEEAVKTVRHELEDYEAVVGFLLSDHDRRVVEIADAIAEGIADRDDWKSFGGFTVMLENRFGCMIEIALGSKFGLLMQFSPGPLVVFQNGPDSDETLVFFIDGGHHTEYSLRELAFVDDCKKCLAEWLESGKFPRSGR